MISQWTGLCACNNPIYNGNPSCSNCMSEKVKLKRLQEKKEEKQVKTLQKSLERSRGGKTAIKPVSKQQSQEQA